MDIQLLSRNGKIKSFVGAVAMFNWEIRVCVKVDEHHSFWKHKFNGAVYREKLNLSEIYFKDIASHEFFKPWTGLRLIDFISDYPASEIENKQQENNNEKNNMAKKPTSKKTVTKKPAQKPGKIAFADEQLQSGKFTKAQVADKLAREFGMPEKTATNTVNWAASTMLDRTGKVSKHLPKAGKGETKLTKSKKPAKAKAEKSTKPTKKKTAMPKRKAVIASKVESNTETTAAPAA